MQCFLKQMLLPLMHFFLKLPCGILLGKLSHPIIKFSAWMLSALLLTISTIQTKYAYPVAIYACTSCINNYCSICELGTLINGRCSLNPGCANFIQNNDNSQICLACD